MLRNWGYTQTYIYIKSNPNVDMLIVYSHDEYICVTFDHATMSQRPAPVECCHLNMCAAFHRGAFNHISPFTLSSLVLMCFFRHVCLCVLYILNMHTYILNLYRIKQTLTFSEIWCVGWIADALVVHQTHSLFRCKVQQQQKINNNKNMCSLTCIGFGVHVASVDGHLHFLLCPSRAIYIYVWSDGNVYVDPYAYERSKTKFVSGNIRQIYGHDNL